MTDNLEEQFAQARERLTGSRGKSARERLSRRYGLGPELVARLVGDTEDELLADLARLRGDHDDSLQRQLSCKLGPDRFAPSPNVPRSDPQGESGEQSTQASEVEPKPDQRPNLRSGGPQRPPTDRLADLLWSKVVGGRRPTR